jgi:hypothetical protein
MFKFLDKIIKKINPLRCCFCNATDEEGIILYQTDFVLMNWHYHQKCLTEVICNPDNFPEKLQMAYSLASSIKEEVEKKESLKRCVIGLQDEYCQDKKI